MASTFFSFLPLLVACTGGAGDTASGPGEPGAGLSADAGPDRAGVVGEELAFEVGNSEGDSFLWDFGDQTQAEGGSVSHAWTEPGRYALVLQARKHDGAWVSDSALVSITRARTEVAPRWSSTVAVGGDPETGEDLLWVVNPEAGTLGRITVEPALEEWEACGKPRTLALDGEQVGVACEDDDRFVLFDAATGGREVVELGRGARPFGVVGRDGSWWLSLQGTGEVVRVEDGVVVETITVGPDPRGLALTHDGLLLVSHIRQAEGWLTVVDGVEVSRVALAPDTQGDSDTTTGGVLALVEQVVPSPGGEAWYLPGLHANTLRGTWVSGQPLTFETSLRAVLATVDAEARSEDPLDRKQFDERGRASAVVPSPSGDLLYVLHPGTGTVSVVDPVTGDLAGSLLDVGTFPSGLALSPDGATLYVNAWLDRELRAYPVGELSVNPTPLWVQATLSTEPLGEEVLLGKRVFHDASDTRLSRSGYISCAHCHLDGRDDGLTWDFTDRGEGLRNTTSLEGRGGTAMGRLHWTGNFDEVQDFEHDMRGPFGGEGFLSEADWGECGDTLGVEKAGRSEELDAMAAWLATLDTPPTSPFPGSEAGALAFEEAGCAGCHPAPLYTDSTVEEPLRHDVGTLSEASGQRLGGALDGLDTPTLLGAWATGPWLHDGSAPTLEEAIAAHALETSLDAEQVALLADFVRGL